MLASLKSIFSETLLNSGTLGATVNYLLLFWSLPGVAWWMQMVFIDVVWTNNPVLSTPSHRSPSIHLLLRVLHNERLTSLLPSLFFFSLALFLSFSFSGAFFVLLKNHSLILSFFLLVRLRGCRVYDVRRRKNDRVRSGVGQSRENYQIRRSTRKKAQAKEEQERSNCNCWWLVDVCVSGCMNECTDV